MKKVVITGPECSGKTTLARALGESYNTEYVSEYARSYLADLDHPYTQTDVIRMAEGQYLRQINHPEGQLAIYDTSLLVMKIWYQVSYKDNHEGIDDLYDKSTPDLYLLPHWDIPYVKDPLREHEHRREELYKLYVSALKKSKVDYITIKGTEQERLQRAIEAIDKLIR